MNNKFIDLIGNRYGIVKSIGRGEFGEVWLAMDTQKMVNTKSYSQE
jgi:serine/threonine protein kinase